MTKGVQDLMIAVERARDDFHSALFERGDPHAAAALVTDDCTFEHVPVGGATGRDAVLRYLTESLFPHLPDDLVFRRLSRTGDRWRVAQEDMISFTHDRELPWLLPGVEPTGRRADVLAVSVVSVHRHLVTGWRTLWDYTSLTEQLGVAARATTG